MPRVAWAVLAVLYAGAVWWMVSNNQSDLTSQAAAVLAGAGIEPAHVTIEGRDARLTGVDTSQRAEIEAVLLGVAGVRTVDFVDAEADQPAVSRALRPPVVTTDPVRATTAVPTTTLATSSATTLVPATTTLAPAASTSTATTTTVPAGSMVRATVRDGALAVTGRVASPDVAAAVGRVADLIYAPLVDNQLDTGAVFDPSLWEPALPNALAVLPIIGSAELAVIGDRATISGHARTDALRVRLLETLRQVFGPGVEVVDAIEVTGQEAPYYRFEADAGKVTIEGRLPDDDIAALIATAAIEVYGAGNVTNNLTVGENIERSFTLFRAPLLFTQFAPVPNWELEVDGDEIAGGLRGGATFAYASARLTPELEILVQTAAGVLIRNRTLGVRIDGHTDDTGPAHGNQLLSERRANAGAEALRALGVSDAQVTAVGFGEAQPIAPNTTEEGRALNRRIDFAFSTIGE